MGLASNPYVVFADVAISMSFVFLIYSLATSQAVLGITRMHRQTVVSDSVHAMLSSKYPNLSVATAHRIDPATRQKEDVDEYRLEGRNSSIALEIKINAGLERFSLRRPMFDRGSASIADQNTAALFADIASELAKSSDSFTYLNLDGVTEPGEADPRVQADIDLSAARAKTAYKLLRDRGIIGSYPEHRPRSGIP